MPVSVRQTIVNQDGKRFEGRDIHLRQGDMDGACGPYCLVMALIALGLTNRDEVTRGAYHGNSRIALLFQMLESQRGDYFFRKGTEGKHFERAIKASFHQSVELEYENDGLVGREYLALADSFVRKPSGALPVILKIDYGANVPNRHWILMVGYEEHDRGSRYLLLDPGEDAPRSGTCWNATLETKGGGSPLPYVVKPNKGRSYRVSIAGAIGLRPRCQLDKRLAFTGVGTYG